MTETFNPSYHRQCGCKEPAFDEEGNPVLDRTGKQKMLRIGVSCPRLKADKKHGSWHLYFELEAGESNSRRRVRRGGFATKKAAERKAAELYREAVKGTDILSDSTVGEDLDAWIERKKRLARTTAHGYEEHIRLYLKPHLGHIKRRDLKLRHVEAMYAAIERENAERLLHHARIVELREARDAAHTAWVRAAGKTEERRSARRAYLDANAALREGSKGKRKITSVNTMHRINATLSSFLTSGIKRGDYTTNWAKMVELPPIKKPRALIWTPERVADWQRTGEKPSPVMVWTPEQTGEFLDFIATDRLAAMWHGFIFRGPRRGEMCALPKTEVGLSGPAQWFRISAQVVEVAYRLYDEAPKQDSVRTVSLDQYTGALWAAYAEARDQEREKWGEENAYVESDRFWVREDGTPLHPDWVSRRFNRLVELSGLPPVRLHDTRHLSAALALLGGAPMKVVQERLGHKSFQITSDTYTTVLPQLLTAEAETTSAVVPRPAQPGLAPTPEKRARGRRSAGSSGTDQATASEGEAGGKAPGVTRDAVTGAPNEGFERAA
ncbi:tyrosine-type recombinase/integrase [Streptomyces hydrogenans]|uniref:tyrosine-type recombinase/integrase n=1 Tax=Streptomyces hydrogenans TaxID=1873719 RepID=UPI0035DB704A